MLRRLSTKWVLAVLASVVVPFLGFAWYVDVRLADRLSSDIVRYYLLSLAADLAARVDGELDERKLDMELWATDPLVVWSVGPDADDFVPLLQEGFDRFVRRSGTFDLLLALDRDGRCVVSNGVDQAGAPLDPELDARLRGRPYGAEPWFRRALGGESVLVDFHRTDLHPSAAPSEVPRPEDYAVGIAEPVRAPDSDEVIGVVYGSVNWTVFQTGILDTSRSGYFKGLIGSEIYASSYAWLWKSDGNTIIAHPRKELYGKRVAEEPVALPQLVAAANADEWAMFPEYEFGGVRKQAAFRHCKGPARGGLGWVVGIGIDNSDIYATVNELNNLLVKATIVVLGVVVLWTFFIARRTTRPILELTQHTRAVAAGDLESRIDVRSKDELGELAEAFNKMTAELAQSRSQLVRAEKEAAWREMARQVAHEIKNPLTPISLSMNLLRRARDEDSAEFDKILERTLELVGRQVENMREIAQNFYLFAGRHETNPGPTDLRALVDEVLDLSAAWAEELGVEIGVSGEGTARLDPTEFRRVLINLVNNALEAMPDGGRLEVRIEPVGQRVRLVVRDTGEGVPEEVRAHLFEPYFTTRSGGTGLGLAICKRVVDELGGEIELRSAEGGGTEAVLTLPT
ncbi:MAG: sensor histidine kinase [Planctomycetes bacterium]|nr:sensor histidine kinase [Planctomycetota bacterium]